MTLRANQKPFLVIDRVAEKVVYRGGRPGCIDFAREHGGPCEIISLAAGLVLEPNRDKSGGKQDEGPARPATKAPKKAASKKAANG